MRSADIPDGFEHFPDVGACPVCTARSVRVKADGTLFQHWRYGWPKRNGHPPCAGTGQQPTVLNESRVTRYLVKRRERAAGQPTDVDVGHRPVTPATPR